MRKLIILVLSMMLTNAFGQETLDKSRGEWGSGGGNALVCFQAHNGSAAIKATQANSNIIPNQYIHDISFIEVYDLYEAKKRRGTSSNQAEIVTIGDTEGYYDYFDSLGKRFQGRVDKMYDILSNGRTLIPDSHLLFHDYGLAYQNDLGGVTLPGPNCLITTMAAQVNYGEFYEVHIDERLFDHRVHSKQSKATLLLHELIYAVGRKMFKHEKSGGTRNLVRLFISYHSSINDESVAKAVYDLNFLHKGAFEGIGPLRYVERIYSSRLYQSLSYGWLNAFELLRPIVLEGFKKDQDFLELSKKIKIATINYDPKYPFEPKDIFEAWELIHRFLGYARGANLIEWKSLLVEIIKINDRFQADLELKANPIYESVFNEAFIGTHILEDQKERILAGAKAFIRGRLNSRIQMEVQINRFEQFKNRDFYGWSNFFHNTVFDSISVGCHNNGLCLGQLKFDNIIPK